MNNVHVQLRTSGKRVAVGMTVLCGIILVCGSARAESDGGGGAYGGLFSAPAPIATNPTSLNAPVPVVGPPTPLNVPVPQINASAPLQPVDGQLASPGSWAVNGSGPSTASQLWGSGNSTSAGRSLPTGASDGYCDPQVAKLDEQLRSQVIDARTQLARSTYSILPTGMLNLGCIDRILNSTVNIFGPGGLQGILNQLLGAFSCERILRTVNGYANQKVSEYSSQAMGYISNGVNSLGIGEVLPGVTLGSLTSGRVNLNPSVNLGGAGSNGSGYVNLGQAWSTGGSYISNGGAGGGSVIMPSRLLGQ